MIRTATAAAKACTTDACPTATNQTTNVASDMAITIGTKTALTWSANF